MIVDWRLAIEYWQKFSSFSKLALGQGNGGSVLKGATLSETVRER
jgi:hypothetical protein